MKRRKQTTHQNQKDSIGLAMLRLFAKSVVIMVLIFIVILIGFLGYLQHQWSNSDLLAHDRIHIVEYNQTFQTMSSLLISPESREYIRIVYPNDTSVPVSYGYGEYSIKSLVGLAVQEDQFPELWISSINHWSGIDNHHYVIKSQSRRLLCEYCFSESSLNFPQKVWLQFQLYSKAEQVFEWTPTTGSLPDGVGEVLKIDFEPLTIPQVVIINTTGVSNLATNLSTILSVIGLDVVGVRNSNEAIDATKVLIASEYHASINLKTALQSWLPLPKNVEYADDLNEYRSDVVIYLANDYVELVSRKN